MSDKTLPSSDAAELSEYRSLISLPFLRQLRDLGLAYAPRQSVQRLLEFKLVLAEDAEFGLYPDNRPFETSHGTRFEASFWDRSWHPPKSWGLTDTDPRELIDAARQAEEDAAEQAEHTRWARLSDQERSQEFARRARLNAEEATCEAEEAERMALSEREREGRDRAEAEDLVQQLASGDRTALAELQQRYPEYAAELISMALRRRAVSPARGNSKKYLLARLERDAPMFHAMLRAGQFPSVYAAARAAGIIGGGR